MSVNESRLPKYTPPPFKNGKGETVRLVDPNGNDLEVTQYQSFDSILRSKHPIVQTFFRNLLQKKSGESEKLDSVLGNLHFYDVGFILSQNNPNEWVHELEGNITKCMELINAQYEILRKNNILKLVYYNEYDGFLIKSFLALDEDENETDVIKRIGLGGSSLGFFVDENCLEEDNKMVDANYNFINTNIPDPETIETITGDFFDVMRKITELIQPIHTAKRKLDYKRNQTQMLENFKSAFDSVIKEEV